MDTFNDIVLKVDDFVWGPWLLIPLLALTGLILTVRLRGVQFTKLWPALRLGLIQRKDSGAEGDISHYQALTTALAATVGVGNIAGVATAIGVGGPGALFWMWVTGLLGMASKYAEAFLGSHFRQRDAKGEQFGGPQVYLERGIKGPLGKILALAFAVFGALAAFGIGNMTQVNTVASQMEGAFGVPPLVTGLVIVFFVGLVLLGGIKRIGQVTAGFVPVMILFYIIGGLIVLIIHFDQLPAAFGLVFTDAFTGTAATGGFIGSTVAMAIQKGMARGIFSNESGMGSSAIVAAAAKTSHPVRQGLVSMTQTFIDTIIVVSFTGLVIIASGAWQQADQYAGAALTAVAFNEGALGQTGNYIVAISVVFFALSTVLGWSYYGERCAVRLFGIKAQTPYRLIFTLACVVGALWELDLVWNIADVLNGLMALPNLIGLIILSGFIARETKAYLAQDPKLRAVTVADPAEPAAER
ncbi:MAG: sodium:alanine symporter family protein [Propionibacteriaceae bacterium]|jgi:AGCS family alanine or glycine:cation symporter|nr:sodium:alanine symporter family protein [Propionibacteriaceae bacterium]